MIDNNDQDQKDQSSIEDSLIDLLDKEEVRSTSFKLFIISFCIMTLMIGVNLWDSVVRYNDESIQLVSCPKSFEVNSPSLLKVVRDGSVKQKDIWVRTFIANYFTNQFPINSTDAEAALTFAVNHSSGRVKKIYENRLDNLREFKRILDDGYFFEVYAKDNYDIKIRARSSNKWSVQIEAFMIHNIRENKLGKAVILTYEIELGDHTLSNPEGLYVYDANTEIYEDYITGAKK